VISFFDSHFIDWVMNTFEDSVQSDEVGANRHSDHGEGESEELYDNISAEGVS
jgi:hypothetical protein